ncbi:MAG: glycosyltransferase family 2 protein [Syntrophales bacterium]|nr:glycosyltransferase family 2 protein [Syntrophales bacterium]
MESKIPISVAIITKNEEANLPRCLASVSFAKQVVVVDSGSTDGTVDIARSFGCDVYEEPWRGGFGIQKQLAVDRCCEPWVLVLDADERLPEETVDTIIRVVTEGDPDVMGYSFPRKNFFHGRWIRHAGWWPDRVVRLFRRGCGRMSTALVHEGVEVDGKVMKLECPIEHFTDGDLARILQKIDRYSTLGAKTAFSEGKRATIFGATVRAGWTFFYDYVFRFGFLDGEPGLTLAVTDAINKFFKYAKLARLCREKLEVEE